MPYAWRELGAIALFAFAARAQSSRLDPAVCATCHAAIWQSYRATGMGRSFFRPRPDNTIENYASHAYYHAASDTYFEMLERDGRYFQRQYQLAPSGNEINVTETEIDYVMGSGNHARTYLHRDQDNQLIELPLGWYAEAGGYWAMNPGYDRHDHAGLSRAIPYACMFCHNGYPDIPAAQGPRADPVFSSVPEGIDCQRCHGDGRRHVALARGAGSRIDEIRGAIVNPARLPPARKLEVCLECHLEPNSASTSNLIPRYEEQPFSYRPGEPLADSRLYFDQKPAEGSADRFEIAGASAYRLMQSQCFIQSKGALTCITCHDPHRAMAPEEAAKHYSAVCEQCHAAKLAPLVSAGRHTAATDCAECHMPKRRTMDAVHVVMTDHWIQRRKPERDLLAAIPEVMNPDNGGEVVPYDPPSPARPEDELYRAIAQVNVASNRTRGIARLTAAIAKFHPAAAEYYLQLGDALRSSRRYAEAVAAYREAIRREPQSGIAHERLALGLTRVRQFAEADAQFREAGRLAPRDAEIPKDAGLAYIEQNRMGDAAAEFRKCLAIDANQAVAHNGLAGALMKTGDPAGAEAEFREAIRLRPHYAEARHNLAFLLTGERRFDEAQDQFEEALRLNPSHTETRFDYAAMLAGAQRDDEAQRQIEAVLRADPRQAKAHDLLGTLLAAKGQRKEAIAQFREAVRLEPGYARANFDLGAALAASGERAAAAQYLEKAAQSSDAQVREAARKLLESIR